MTEDVTKNDWYHLFIGDDVIHIKDGKIMSTIKIDKPDQYYTWKTDGWDNTRSNAMTLTSTDKVKDGRAVYIYELKETPTNE